jgi:hypothetical protein
MTDLSIVEITCAEPSCDAPVCERGDVCRDHQGMTVCPSCLQTCDPYQTQTEWWQKTYWACDKCDSELVGFVPTEYWDVP